MIGLWRMDSRPDLPPGRTPGRVPRIGRTQYRGQTPFDSAFPTRRPGGKEYVREQFGRGDLVGPDGQLYDFWYDVGSKGCIGLAWLRLGSVSLPEFSEGAWFNYSNAAVDYWNSLTPEQQNNSVVIAIQSIPYPTNIVRVPGKLGRIKPGF